MAAGAISGIAKSRRPFLSAKRAYRRHGSVVHLPSTRESPKIPIHHNPTAAKGYFFKEDDRCRRIGLFRRPLRCERRRDFLLLAITSNTVPYTYDLQSRVPSITTTAEPVSDPFPFLKDEPERITMDPRPTAHSFDELITNMTIKKNIVSYSISSRMDLMKTLLRVQLYTRDLSCIVERQSMPSRRQ